MTNLELTKQGKAIANAIIATLEAEGITAKVENTYLDFGQDITWDTIIVYKNGASNYQTDRYQALNPKTFEAINKADFDNIDFKEIIATAKNIVL